MGWRLVQELRGQPYHDLLPSEDGTLARQSISYSRSFGQRLTSLDDLWGAVSTYLSRAAEMLRAQGDQTHLLTVFLSQDRYDARVPPPYTRSTTLTLPSGPTADTLRLTVPAAGQPAPWLGKSEHRTPAYTTRLEDLLTVR